MDVYALLIAGCAGFIAGAGTVLTVAGVWSAARWLTRNDPPADDVAAQRLAELLAERGEPR